MPLSEFMLRNADNRLAQIEKKSQKYQLWDSISKICFSNSYTNYGVAARVADQKNFNYGAVRYFVRHAIIN